MRRYVVRRILLAIPLLLAISFVCFMFINLIPSNPAEVALRVQQMPVITEEAIAKMEEMLGLNKPFVVRYIDWIIGCLHGRFRHKLCKSGKNRFGRNFTLPPCNTSACGSIFYNRYCFKCAYRFFVCRKQRRMV